MLASTGEDEDWDFGTGADFYLDVKKSLWVSELQDVQFIIQKELIDIIDNNFDININKIDIWTFHGGAWRPYDFSKNQNVFKSVSACAHMQSNGMPWGKKAFTNYLGTEIEAWKSYDACELVAMTPQMQKSLLTKD